MYLTLNPFVAQRDIPSGDHEMRRKYDDVADPSKGSLIFFSNCQSSTLHTNNVLSSLLVAMYYFAYLFNEFLLLYILQLTFPIGSQATPFAQLVCPDKTFSGSVIIELMRDLSILQIMTLLSILHVASIRSSGDHATSWTSNHYPINYNYT